ncbi:MAG: ABC transporter permease [Oscillospiraceae bacterium]|nr:ABC transporter permease [Oscillospiraceae bacterium]
MFIAFCKKEAVESLRTYRLIIMLAAFAMFGIISPLTAKLMPDIIRMSGVEGIIIELPEPGALDAWTQFYSNISQMGVLTLAIVFCGITANEFSRGTLVNILTKGVRRRTVIHAKFTAAAAVWTLCYGVSLAAAYAYTAYYWDTGELPYTALAFVSPWVYGLFLIALLILGGILLPNVYGSLAAFAGAVLIMSLLNIAPGIQKYNPISLSGGGVMLLSGQKPPGDFVPALIVCASLTIAAVTGAGALFNRRQL